MLRERYGSAEGAPREYWSSTSEKPLASAIAMVPSGSKGIGLESADMTGGEENLTSRLNPGSWCGGATMLFPPPACRFARLFGCPPPAPSLSPGGEVARSSVELERQSRPKGLVRVVMRLDAVSAPLL